MTEALSAEFDTVAEWTADAALELGPDYHLPAACRGSGSPESLAWLLDELGVAATDRFLDCGAGVGGPAALARDRIGVQPVLVEPEAGACRAARRLFGFDPVRASGARLPFRDGSFDVAWCLGVLCTTPDQLGLLIELRRVLTPAGRLGLLVFTATTDRPLTDRPAGNHFPTETELAGLIAAAGFQADTAARRDDFGDPTSDWAQRGERVESVLERDHGRSSAWHTSVRQVSAVRGLLGSGEVVGRVLVLRSA